MPFSGEYDGSILAVLESLRETAELEGLALLDLSEAEPELTVPYSIGPAGFDTVALGRGLLTVSHAQPTFMVASDGRPIIACPGLLPPARRGGLVMWRAPGERPWSEGDISLAASIAMLLNTTLISGPGHAGIDRLTGLPNRRWFFDEAERYLERLDVDGQAGTLTLVDADDLRHLNLTMGRKFGDRVLMRLANHLRAGSRAGDVVARIGPDEFALWQSGMDAFTAAERAAGFCGLTLFSDLPDDVTVSVSIGIASRQRGSIEDVRTLLRRAHMAAREAKAAGGGGWRVSHTVSSAGYS